MIKLLSKLGKSKIQTGIAISILVIILFLFSFGHVSFNDFWWHLAVGKWMFKTGSLLTHEIFSFAFQGKEWLNNTWLFDAAMYQIHAATGFTGLSLLRFIIFSATYFFLIKTANLHREKSLIVISVAAFILTIPQIRNFLRPEIISPLFISIYLSILYYSKHDKSRLLYLLPLLMAFWVNLHGGFPSGVILVAIFAASEGVRLLIKHRNRVVNIFKEKILYHYALIGIGTFLATFINPYGYRIYDFFFNMLADNETLASVAEWRPVSISTFLEISVGGQLAFILFGWLALTALLVGLLRTLYRSSSPIYALSTIEYEDILIFSFFLSSALTYVRGIHVFTIIATFLFIKNIESIQWLYRLIVRERLVSTSLLFLACLVVLPWQAKNTFNTGPSITQQPKESITFVREHQIPGNYINEYGSGGDLIWLLYPDYQVYIDGRSANVYDARYFWEYRSLNNEYIFADLINKYDITFAIANNSWGTTSILEENDAWHLVFFDANSSIFVRDAEETSELIDKFTYKEFSPKFNETSIKETCTNPDRLNTVLAEMKRNMEELEYPLFAYGQAASLINECLDAKNNLVIAEKMLHAALSVAPDSTTHRFTLALIQLKLEKEDLALKNINQVMHKQQSAQIITAKAIALHNLGNYQDAKLAFDYALWTGGSVPDEYYRVYGRTLYQLDINDRAIDMTQRYLDITPEEKHTAQDYLDLSYAYNDNGQPEKAEEARLKAEQLQNDNEDNE